MKRCHGLLGLMGALLVAGPLSLLAAPATQVARSADGFAEPKLPDKSALASAGRNPYFILEPGYQLRLETPDGKDYLLITVLDETKVVDGVETRVVEERETEHGQIVEVSRNFFAVSKESGDLYYFGEEVDTYEDGKVTGHAGAWQAGVDGAKAGLMIPGKPTVGQKAYQEMAPKVAMDRFEVASLKEAVTTPAGKFDSCLKVIESSALEKGEETKLYAPGVGLLRDEDFRLVKYGKADKVGSGDKPNR